MIGRTPISSYLPALKPGRVTATRTIPEIGVTEWTLENGALVFVKPTKRGGDDVELLASSHGDTELTQPAEFGSATCASRMLNDGGLGAFDPGRLAKALARHRVSLHPAVRRDGAVFSGEVSASDVELLLQLLHLAFTAPRRDDAAFARWQVRALRFKPRPRYLAGAEMAWLQSKDASLRAMVPWTGAPQANPETALALYKERFGDASRFVFGIVGDVELDRLKSMVETYVGSLASTRSPRSLATLPPVASAPPVQKLVLTKGVGRESAVEISFQGEEHWSRASESDFQVLAHVLTLRLNDFLRAGNFFSCAPLSVSARHGPAGAAAKVHTWIDLDYECGPNTAEQAEHAILEEIGRLQTDGVTEDDLARARQEVEAHVDSNGSWVSSLLSAYTYGYDPRRALDEIPVPAEVTPDRLRAAASRYLSDQRYFMVVVNPEAEKQ